MIAEGADAAPLGEMLESVLDGTVQAWSTSRIVGYSALWSADRPRVRALNAGCPLDLGLKAFPVGMATRTLFDKAEIVLWRRAQETFQVEVWRSFAPYLVAALTEAARGAPTG